VSIEVEFVAREFNVDPLNATYRGAVVGGETALDTHDGDVSYAEVGYTDFSDMSEVTFRLEPLSPIPSGTPFKIEFEVDAAWAGGDQGGFLYVGGRFPTGGGRAIAAFTVSDATYTDARIDGSSNMFEGFNMWAELSSPDLWWTLTCSTPGFSGSTVLRATFLRCFITYDGGGEPLPLRQRQRDDGLGMSGTVRWGRGSSRQLSNRWRGYV
jgi:hypothetical protein